MGMNQKTFGESLGVNINTVSNWEREVAFPPADKLAFIRQEYQININWLLTGEGVMKNGGGVIANSPSQGFDFKALEQIIEGVEEGLLGKEQSLTPSKKARLITILCEYAFETGKKVEKETIEKYLGLLT